MPLTSDIVFKRLFSKKEILKDFLEDILEEKIEDVKYLDREINGIGELRNKECRFDIRVKLENGTYINVEMQKSRKGDMLKRSIFYIALMVGESLEKSEDYENISKYIGINIIDYKDNTLKKYHTILKLYDKKGIEDKEEKEIYKSDIIQIHFINLNSEVNNSKKLYKWKELFKEEESWDNVKYNDKRIKKAVKELRKLSNDKEVVSAYQLEEKIRRDRISENAYIRKTAIEEGKNEGLKKGLEQGLEQGREEEKRQNAINFYKNGISKDLISKSLNISLESLEKILANYKI